VTVTRLRDLAGLALASTVLLTGCGAVPAFNPGVAARVGDETISVREVDEVTESYCAAAEAQLQQGQGLPQHYLRGQVAGGLALRAVADQFAAEYGVSAGDQYAQAVAQARRSPQVEGLTEDQVQALIDVQGAPVYLSAVETSAGEVILEREGGTSTEPNAAQAAGEKAFLAWLEDQDVRIDPRFSVSLVDGQSVPTDSSISFALGETAKRADAREPDTDYAAGLPDSQRCG
jgi:peptidyl-prolyl cis-trans isomerase SurA